MGYAFESKVRYSETGEDGALTLPSILNYFQDCCTFHSESIGQGRLVLEKRKRLWVLSSWQIIVERYPQLGEDIVIETWPYDFKGFLGSRNFRMLKKDGECLAYANTLWTHMDLEKGIPAKLTQEDIQGYDLSPKLEMDYAPRKIALPEEMQEQEAFLVRKHHLDTNHHVNNGQYIQMAAEYLPENFKIWQMRAEYKIQAVLDNEIRPFVKMEGNKFTAALMNTEGKPYAVIEFSERAPL